MYHYRFWIGHVIAYTLSKWTILIEMSHNYSPKKQKHKIPAMSHFSIIEQVVECSSKEQLWSSCCSKSTANLWKAFLEQSSSARGNSGKKFTTKSTLTKPLWLGGSNHDVSRQDANGRGIWLHERNPPWRWMLVLSSVIDAVVQFTCY